MRTNGSASVDGSEEFAIVGRRLTKAYGLSGRTATKALAASNLAEAVNRDSPT